MTSKVWRRKDSGERLIRLRVQFFVDRADMVSALCKHAINAGAMDALEEADLPPEPSRAWILDKVRDVRFFNFESMDYWADDISDDLADDIRAWAEHAVTRRFPEMAQ